VHCEAHAAHNREVSKRSSRPYLVHRGDVCERCGFVPVIVEQLDVHHANGQHEDNTPSNLVTLCANCHRLAHHEMRAAGGPRGGRRAA
jgi:predicted HNH restriction endonuclease